MVRAKKYLGQHFLKDQSIAAKISASLEFHEGYSQLLEIGPGTGVLTNYLTKLNLKQLTLVEIDHESVVYLKQHFSKDSFQLLEDDFLEIQLSKIGSDQLGIIGNFPYNISSQIFFKVLENRQQVPEVVCMLQKEVAQRICANEGSKVYGILSVLLGAFYKRELLFNVPPHVFIPPPKVDSAVIRLQRLENQKLPCDEKLFFRIVKQGFQNRRKTLRNALKPVNLPPEIIADSMLNLRAEQLSVSMFIELVQKIEAKWKIS